VQVQERYDVKEGFKGLNTKSISSERVYGPGIIKETKSGATVAFTSKPIYYKYIA
jgi:hypothetical protein